MTEVARFFELEHQAIRAEILFCLEQRISMLSYGFAGIGAMTAGGVGALSKDIGESFPLLAPAIFGILIPASTILIWNFWMNESARVRRASQYLWYIEKKCNNLTGINALEWEHHLRRDDKYTHSYRLYELMTIYCHLFSYCSVVLATYLLIRAYAPATSLMIPAGIETAIFGYSVWAGLNRAAKLDEDYRGEITSPLAAVRTE